MFLIQIFQKSKKLFSRIKNYFIVNGVIEMTSCSIHLANKTYAIKDFKTLTDREKHNRRLYKDSIKNYKTGFKKELINNGSYLESYKKIIEKNVLPSIQKFNERQTRKDRKIDGVDGYMKKLEKYSKQDVACELIVQVGDIDYWRKHNGDREKMEDVYKGFLEFTENYFPQFKVFSCTFHNDETSPHIHIVGVPIVDGLKSGTDVGVSKTKVFNRQRLIDFQAEGRRTLELLMKSKVDPNFEFGEKRQGRNYDYSVSEITEMNKQLDKRIEMLQDKQKKIAVMAKDLSRSLNSIDIFGKNKNKVTALKKEVSSFVKSVRKDVNNLRSECENLSVGDLKLEDTNIGTVRKYLNRRSEKELKKLVKTKADDKLTEYLNSNAYKSFLEQQMIQARQDAEKKARRKFKHREELEKLEKELAKLTELNESSRAEYSELSSKVNGMRKTQEDMSVELKTLTEKKDVLDKEIKNLELIKSNYDTDPKVIKHSEITKELKKITPTYMLYKSVADNYDDKINDVKSDYNYKLVEARSRYEKELSKMQSKYDKELSEMKSKYESDITDLRLKDYFFERASIDVSEYFNCSQDEAYELIEAKFGDKLVKGMIDYLDTGEIDRELLYGSEDVSEDVSKQSYSWGTDDIEI